MFSSEKPITLIRNGKIYLFDDDFTQVQSLAISNDRIIAAGSDDELLSYKLNSTEMIDLEGRTITPGLIDAHVHIQGMSRQLSMVDCETDKLEECLERIKLKVYETPPGTWILGRGWNQNPWGRYGTREDLDELTSQHPIYLIAKSGHAAWVNSMALTIAGIADQSPSIEGGEIQLGEAGKPSGVLFENSMKLVSVLIPHMSMTDLIDGIQTIQENLWALGVTGFHDFDGSSVFTALQHMYDENNLGMRVVKNIPLDQLDNAIELGLHSNFGNDWLRIGNVKIFADGALGPQTAAMIDPYSGKGSDRGILLIQAEDLTETISNAARHGLAVSIHAIGDQANHVVLDAFENVRLREKTEQFPSLRHRIEHLQLLHPSDLHRPASLKIIVSMQPLHATSDMLMADRYWSNRARYSYAWRSQLDSGATLIFGSDAPIEVPNPFLGLHAAVTRRRLDGSPCEHGWIPEERITLQEAFYAYTRGPSYAAGLENELGCLLPGYLADLLIFDEDPFNCTIEELPYIRAIATMVGGNWKLFNL